MEVYGPSWAEAMLKKDDCAILDTQMPAVDQTIGEHPELARSLVHMLVTWPARFGSFRTKIRGYLSLGS